MLRLTPVLIALVLLFSTSCFAFYDLGPLLELVAGQLQEINRLSENLGIAKDQLSFLKELNDGISQSVQQLEDLQEIVDRAQNLDPTQVKSLSDLNDLLERANSLKARIDDVLEAKIFLANEAISASAIQSDTAYRVGEDLTWTGANLAAESRTASPGRAEQISAAAGSAQMVASGVQLQTLSQMTQLQAMNLEFEKTQFERDLQEKKLRNAAYQQELTARKTGGAHE